MAINVSPRPLLVDEHDVQIDYQDDRESHILARDKNTALNPVKIFVFVVFVVLALANLIGSWEKNSLVIPAYVKLDTEVINSKPMKDGNANVVRRPHIVFIVADDLGWNDVGWHNKDIMSPNIDNLAKTGVILDNYYTFPTCTPSRAAILTGYYSHRLGLQHRTIAGFQTKHVPTNVTMIAEKLQDLGYSTHAIGKWHLGHCNWYYTPTYRGFDTFFGYKFSSGDYYTHFYHGMYEMWENERPFIDKENTYSADLFSKRAENVIRDHAETYGNDKSLYLYLAFQNIHGPQADPPEKYRIDTPYKLRTRRFVSHSIKAMDDAVGHVVDTLKENDLYENTLIIFVSDNGGDVANGGNNLPFRGGKFSLWEGGTRVAAFIHSPMIKNPGRVHDGLFHVVDWFPTVLSAADAELVTDSHDYDGIDMWISVRDGTISPLSTRKDFVYTIDPMRNAAIRVGNYKLIVGNPVDGTYEYTVHNHRGPSGDPNGWLEPNKYFRAQGSSNATLFDKIMLFNIRDDPTERNNLAKSLPDVVEMLTKRLENEKARAVPLQAEQGIRRKAMTFVRDNILYPGWC